MALFPLWKTWVEPLATKKDCRCTFMDFRVLRIAISYLDTRVGLVSHPGVCVLDELGFFGATCFFHPLSRPGW